MKQANANFQEAWLRVLGKGMVTLPKKWREELGVTTGDVIKAKKEGTRVVIEARQVQSVPYRTYTNAEINDFLEEDRLPKKLARKVKNHLSSLLTP